MAASEARCVAVSGLTSPLASWHDEPALARTSTPSWHDVALTLLEEVAGQPRVDVKWMWNDAGFGGCCLIRQVTKANPLRWSAFGSLELVVTQISGYLESKDAQRAVVLHLHVFPPRGTARSFGVVMSSISEAVAHLKELSTRQHTLKGRLEFPPEPEVDFAQTAYCQYIEHIVELHGGFVGAGVRFTDVHPAFGVRDGMEGLIMSFSNIGSFRVSWGSKSSMVSMEQCALIETADGRFRSTHVKREAGLAGAMGNVADQLRSGPLAFTSACEQLSRMHFTCARHVHNQNERVRRHAVENKICEEVVAVMTADLAESEPNVELQHSGCLAIWWVCFPVVDADDLEVCRELAAKAGALQALIGAHQAFPTDAGLRGTIRQAVSYIIFESPSRRQQALDLGWE